MDGSGRRRQKSFFGRTQAEAGKKMRDAQRRSDQGLPQVPETLTVEKHLRDWLVVKKATLRPESYRRYEDLCRLYLIPELGRFRLARLTVAQVQAAYASIGERVSGTTTQHCHGVLHAALKDAERWGLVGRNVASLVTAPRRTTGEMRFLSPENARLLLEAARGDQLEAFYVVALMCGFASGNFRG